MNKIYLIFLVLLVVVVSGCKEDEDPKGSTLSYTARHLWPRGSYPIPSPSGQEILFLQEESPAGLYFLKDSIATLVHTDPAVRSDYSWSTSGNYFCFSAVGNEGGIFVQNKFLQGIPVRIWERGSNPRFLFGDTVIVCSGPEDGSDFEGLWEINLTNLTRTRLTAKGVSPEVSRDARKIAYMQTVGSSEGRILLIYNWQQQIIDTVGLAVLNFTWLGDSRTLIYESVADGIQNLLKTQIGIDPPGQYLGISGSNPKGFGSLDKFFYTSIDGDTSVGIFLGGLDLETEEVFLGGSNAAGIASDKVFAQTMDGLYELTR